MRSTPCGRCTEPSSARDHRPLPVPSTGRLVGSSSSTASRTGTLRTVELGVGRGDSVAAYMPNIPETVVLMLATATLGAVFSSCAPEFGASAVLDRFGQIEPTVLVAVDGYRYGERARRQSQSELEAIRAGLPSLTVPRWCFRISTTITAIGQRHRRERSLGTNSCPITAPLEFEQVEFDHPLYVLYSSGTTGLPKPIVHSHGGILLEHCKALGLHVRPR